MRLRGLSAAGLFASLAWCPLAGASEHGEGHGSSDHQTEASTTDPVCKVRENAVIQKVGLNGDHLDYFISSAKGTVYVITGGGNQKLDMDTGKMSPVPNAVDPVPTPDGKYLTTPMDGSLKFFKVGDIDPRSTKTPQSAVHGGLTGVYQSLGILPKAKSSDPTVYRAITDAGGATYQDYRVGPNGRLKALHGESKPTKRMECDPNPPLPPGAIARTIMTGPGLVIPNPEALLHPDRVVDPPAPVCREVDDVEAPQGERMCPNLDSTVLQMPMLSKDGRYISAYNVDTQTTKIYAIDAQANCKETLDLGVRTGKVDFDIGNKRIAFHMDSYNSFRSGYFSGVESDMTKDVYVLNLDTDARGTIHGMGSFTRLSTSINRGSGTYYPRFDGTGKVVAARDEDGKFSVVKMDPTKAQYAPHWTPELGKPGGMENTARLALGGLWNAVCADRAADNINDASRLSLSMDPVACKEMIRKYWNDQSVKVRDQLMNIRNLKAADIAAVSIKDMQAICPKDTGKPTKVREIGSTLLASKTAAQIFQSSCRDCHASGTSTYRINGVMKTAPKMEFDKMTLNQVAMAQAYVRMPPETGLLMPPISAGQLSAMDKQVLIQNFEQRMRDMGEAQSNGH